MMIFIETLFFYIVAIGVLVLFHEFGHFVVARWCGVHVERFSIGFGRPLYSFKNKHQTEFVIAPILFGGYVKMLDDRLERVDPAMQCFAFNRQRIAKRILIVIAGPLANFILSAVILSVVFMLGVPVQRPIIKDIVPNSVVARTKISPGAELKSIAGIKVDSWKETKIALMSVLESESISITYQPKGYEGVVSAKLNLASWPGVLDKTDPISTLGFIPAQPSVLPVINKVVRNSPAKYADLREGDQIIAVNGNAINTWDDFIQEVVSRPGEQASITVKRAQQSLVLPLTLGIKMDVNGKQIGFAGIMPMSDVIIRSYGILPAAWKSVQEVGNFINITVTSFWALLTGKISVKQLAGPVTIAKTAGESANSGLATFLLFLAFISVSLGVMNLLPLPVLDGGHIVLLLIEKVRGRALSQEAVGRCYRFGLILLLMLMGLALFNDFSRL